MKKRKREREREWKRKKKSVQECRSEETIGTQVVLSIGPVQKLVFGQVSSLHKN